jgi:uncharacterized protein DUF6010
MSLAAAIPRLGLRGHARSIAVGLTVGLFTVACAAALSRSQAHLYLGLLLAAVGWVYLGFGVADGRTSAIAVQAVSITVVLNVAYLGVQLGVPVILGVGFLAHGAWDWVHHDGHGQPTCGAGTRPSARPSRV